MTQGNDQAGDRNWVCTNYSAAHQFDDPDRIVAIRDVISSVGCTRITRSIINEHLSVPLSARESASLFVCLQKNGAAEQVSSSGGRFADYAFEVQSSEAAYVLTQQAAALAANSSRGPANEVTVSFVATLPAGFETSSIKVRSLQSTADVVRNQVFEASSSIRIANPYFDPSIELVDDLASLPRRGITTQVLTRETRDEDGDALTSLNRMWDQIQPERRHLLEVRDLYKWDNQRRSQVFATHAKVIIVDEKACYVGSANLTDTSLSSNFEFGVVVEGDLISDAVAAFDQVFDYAEPISLPI